MKWEYKTILVPDMDSWLIHEIELFYSADTGLLDSTQNERRRIAAGFASAAAAARGEDFVMESDPAVKKKACDEIFSKHSTFLNEQLGILGQEGWELVSIWNSGPAYFFTYSAQWMTFKRSEEAKRKSIGIESAAIIPQSDPFLEDNADPLIYVQRGGVVQKPYARSLLVKNFAKLFATDEFAYSPDGPWSPRDGFFS